MTVLIQNSITNEFLNSDGAWQQTLDNAKNFTTATEALDFCVTKGLKEAELILHFDFAAQNGIRINVGNTAVKQPDTPRNGEDH